MDWNDETIGRIRALWAEGHSTAEIGRRMGITKNAVVGKAHRLSLPPRPSPIRRGTADSSLSQRPARIAGGSTLPNVLTAVRPDLPQAQPVAVALPTLVAPRPETPRLDAPRLDAPRLDVTRSDVTRPDVPFRSVLRPVAAQSRPTGRLSPCCWPLGDPGTPSFRFCGDPALPSKPYCADHASLAYVRVRDRREDAA